MTTVHAQEKQCKLDDKKEETAIPTPPSPKKTDAREAKTQPLRSPIKTKVAAPKKAPTAQTTTKAFVDSKKTASTRTDDSEHKKKPAIPKKGKAPYDCGCFGSVHKALTNCLYCGRITCAKEGYNYCPFCGYMVEERTGKPAR